MLRSLQLLSKQIAMSEISIIQERLERIENLLLGQKTVLNLEEVAEYTHLSKSYLYKLTSTGGIPCYKPKGKHLFFRKTEVDQWLLSNKLLTVEEMESEVTTKVTLNASSINKVNKSPKSAR